MSNSLPFSDSPRRSAFYPVQPTESPLSHATSSNVSARGLARSPYLIAPHSRGISELGNSDGPSTLQRSTVPPSPHDLIRNERNLIPVSSSAPSLRGSQTTRPFPVPASPEAHDARPPTVDGSPGQHSSHHRVSFEGNLTSPPSSHHSPRVQVQPLLREGIPETVQGIDSTMTRIGRSNVSTRPPSVVRSAAASSPTKKSGYESPPPASAPHSRTTSPRRFAWSPFHSSHQDAFVPVDPFRLRTRLRRLSVHNSDIENPLAFDPTCEENPLCCITPVNCSPTGYLLSFLQDARYFVLDTLPRQTYLHLLLRLPSLYFSRIARVYEDAQLSKPDLERMIESYSSSRQREQRQRIVSSSPIPPGAHYHPAPALPFPDEWTSANVSPALLRFKQSWESFVNSLLREWKTLNLVSALLLSAIISMFQSNVMAEDPVIRTAALLSLTSALMSLSYGCIYIVRFGTMKSMYKATRWAEEAARTTSFILWNVWVLLAMPVVWLAWSMIFFIIAILAYVWRYGSSEDPASPPLLSPTAALGPRIAVSALFFLGLLYLVAIVQTLHNYGRTSNNYRLFGRATMRGGMPDLQEDDEGEGEQGKHKGQGTSGRDGDYGHDSPRAGRGRGRERTRGGRARDATELGGLSAVTGLGLRGLDELTGSRGLDEVPREEQQPQTEPNV